MRRLVEFPLRSGGSVIVEVDEPGAVVPAVSAGQVAERAKQTFEDVLDKIKPAAYTIMAKLREGAEPPDEVEIEYGLKIGAKLGAAFVAACDAEANYKVKLTWKSKAKEASGGAS